MVRAQVRGVIDWSEMEFFDRQWSRRVRLLINEMVSEEDRHLKEIAHLHSINMRTAFAAAIDKFEDDVWKKACENASARLDAVITAYRPWDAKVREDREKAEARHLIGGWNSKFGDTSDPEVARKVKELSEAMLRMAEQTAPDLRYQGTIFNKDTAASMPLKGN